MLKHPVWLGAVIVVAMAAPAAAQTGNGAPNGNHYNLNILGKDHCSGDDLTDSNRHTIQVLLNFDDGSNTGQVFSSLDRRNKILLTEGDFQVLDGNACDGDGAKFQLPANPYTCESATSCEDPQFQAYTVWSRALAKPGGSATMTTCTTAAGADGVLQTADDVVLCSNEQVLLVRTTGKSKFENVTKELTTVYADINGDGVVDRVGIFSDDLRSYFWDYDNRGLRLTQLRFYPIGQ